jgi:hypothetical protein
VGGGGGGGDGRGHTGDGWRMVLIGDFPEWGVGGGG